MEPAQNKQVVWGAFGAKNNIAIFYNTNAYAIYLL